MSVHKLQQIEVLLEDAKEDRREILVAGHLIEVDQGLVLDQKIGYIQFVVD
jgi:hypothetical protein